MFEVTQTSRTALAKPSVRTQMLAMGGKKTPKSDMSTIDKQIGFDYL
ncbi:hypothetical protein [Lacihabitans sp. LS3-19]|nr:hypothetical protein [Lacihabitans sp. LS3-19]